MKRNALTFVTGFLLIVVTLSLSSVVLALPGDARPLQQSSLPDVEFLGDGPGSFSVEAPRLFLIKTYDENGEFVFITREGPTYEAVNNERVWTIDFLPAEPIRLFHEGRNYGNVEAGCVVNFVQIEDNLDHRRNRFFINGDELHLVEQGMVTYGTFTVPEDGELTFYAQDSIGIVVELCLNLQTPVASETPESTTTVTALPSVTATDEGDGTPTAQPSGTGTVPPPIVVTLTVTPGTTETQPAPTNTNTPPAATATTGPTNTPPAATATTGPTSTQTAQVPPIVVTVTQTPGAPGATATVGPTSPPASPTPTATAQLIQITATPISTPAAVPVTGGVPGPREIAAISGLTLALLGLVAAAWWFLLRAYHHER